MQPVSDPKPFQFRLWHLFALVTATAVVLSVIFSFISLISLQEEAKCRRQCMDNLKSIGLSLVSYHDCYGSFPPPYVADAQGKPLYSWRVLILPYMEWGSVYDQWRFDEPWDSPHNWRLRDPWHPFGPPPYECPGARRHRPRRSPSYADYLAVVGPGMAWEEGKCLSMDDFTDTASNTIMVVEVRGSRIHWAEPVDFDGTASLKINARGGLSIGSHDPGDANVVFADASFMHLPDTTSEAEIKALLTRDGGEDVDWLRDGWIYDDLFGSLHWSAESWEGNPELFGGLPFSIDFDVVDPTNEQKGLALKAAKKVYYLVRTAWDRKARLDVAKEVTDATYSQSDDTPTDEDVQRLANDMTLESWGMTYAAADAAMFPYFVYTSPKCFPNKRIRIQFSTDIAIDEVTVTE